MTRRGRLTLAVGTACLAAALLVLAFFAHRVDYFPIDLTMTRGVQAVDVPWLNGPLRVLNLMGYKPMVGIVDGAIILLLLLCGARRPAIGAGLSALAAVAANFLLKWLVGRPRPPSNLVLVEHHLSAGNSSFPAGHVLSATVFFGFLGYLAWTRLAPSWPRTTGLTLASVVIGFMGLARIHSGEHWPSDVLGGYLVGTLLLIPAVALYRRAEPHRPGHPNSSREPKKEQRVDKDLISGAALIVDATPGYVETPATPAPWHGGTQ